MIQTETRTMTDRESHASTFASAAGKELSAPPSSPPRSSHLSGLPSPDLFDRAPREFLLGRGSSPVSRSLPSRFPPFSDSGSDSDPPLLLPLFLLPSRRFRPESGTRSRPPPRRRCGADSRSPPRRRAPCSGPSRRGGRCGSGGTGSRHGGDRGLCRRRDRLARRVVRTDGDDTDDGASRPTLLPAPDLRRSRVGRRRRRGR